MQVSPSYKPAYIYGGPTYSIALLCENLVRSGHQVTVYTTTANGPTELDVVTNEQQNVDGVGVSYFRRWTKDHSHLSPSLYIKLWRTLKDYDVVHVQSWWNLVAMPAVVICLLKGIRPIVSMRGTLSEYTFGTSKTTAKKFFHWLIGRRLLKACDLHVTSNKEKEECRRHLGAFNGHIIPNFLNFDEPCSHQLAKGENSVFTVSVLSRIHPVKNLEFVLECFSGVDFDFEILVIGGGNPFYVDSLKKRSNVLSIENKIRWIGPKSGKEKFQLLASSDLFVQLSLTENFGNAIIEASSVGTPVLVSDQTGAAQYVREMNLGWVVELDQIQVIKLINQIYEDKTGRAQIRKVGPELVRERFTGQDLALEYIRAYNEHAQKQTLSENIPKSGV